MSSHPICTQAPSPQLPGGAGVGAVLGDAELIQAARSMRMAGGGSAQMLPVLMDPSIDLGELGRRIGADAGLTARVMRVANSAFYGQSGEVGTLSHAVALLGMGTLRGVAAAACFDRLSLPQSADLDLRAYRYHSLATACAAEILARQCLPALAEQAFVAGLLHDLGILLQHRLRPQAAAAFHGASAALAGESPPSRARHAQMEKHCIGATHAHCGQLALQAWQLPPTLVQAVALHDSGWPFEGARCAEPAATLPGVLDLADRMATAAGYGLEGDGLHPTTPCEPQHAAPLSAAQWQAAVAALPAAVQRLAAVFGD